MSSIKAYILHLKAYDLIVIIFYSLLIILNLIFYQRIEQWKFFIGANLAVIILVFLISFLENKTGNKFYRIIHYWYTAPLILFTFKELYFLIKPIRQNDYDYLLIQIDRWIFGTDPTVFLAKYSHPLLTELLQIVYGLFYVLPIILGLALQRNRRYSALDYAVFSVLYGFFLSYIGYFALPGIGPRFTLHSFESINTELPGIFLTNILREIVNIGESIPTGTVNPAEVVQRDIFPSGHTMITLIVMYLSIKLNSRSKYLLVPVGTLLIFATVYLRYHYVIDLIGGAVLMIFSVWSGKYIFNLWQKKLGQQEFSYENS
jgi:membrane-associated phospholipid phosphatase